MSRKRTSILLAVVVAGAALLAAPFLFAAGKGRASGWKAALKTLMARYATPLAEE